MAKKSIVMPEQFYKGVQMLPPEQQGEAYNAYLEYAFYGKEYDGNNLAITVLLASVTDSIDTAKENYDKKVRKLKEANEQRKQEAIERNNADTARHGADTGRHGENNADTGVDTVIVSVIDSDISPNGDKEKPNAYALGKKKPRPTLDEVKAYADEKGRPEEAEHFFDFYTANGWKVGKNPMKDWQAAFRNWLKNDFDRGKTKVSEADFYASIAEAERTGFGK